MEMRKMMRWSFKVNNKNFTIGYTEYKLLQYFGNNEFNEETYRQIGKKLGIKRGTVKSAGRQLEIKGLISSNKMVTKDGKFVLKSLKEKIFKKEEKLRISNKLVNTLCDWIKLDETPTWFQKSMHSKKYASCVLLFSIDLEGSVHTQGVINIYQTYKGNSSLLFLLSLIVHYHSWNPMGTTIFDDLKNGYMRISTTGLKEMYNLSGPLGNPQKDANAREVIKFSYNSSTQPGWYRFIIENERTELIALAMEEEFMIKNLCLRLKKGDPTQIWLYKACKSLDIVTSKSEESMKKYGGFQLRIDRLPYVLEKVRTFIIPSKRAKILQLLERHKRNVKGAHRYSSRGISIEKMVFDILQSESGWMSSKEVSKRLPDKIKVSDGLVWQCLENLYQNAKIMRRTVKGRGPNWRIRQWKRI